MPSDDSLLPNNRVVWSEGLFIRPHHFQQADQHTEWLVNSRVAALVPFGWGLTGLQINRNLLGIGQFAVNRCDGIFQDGTPFSIPDSADPPPALVLEPGTRDRIVYLTLPLCLPAVPDISYDDAANLPVRYRVREILLEDRTSLSEIKAADRTATDRRAMLQVARLRFCLTTDLSALPDRVAIPLARVAEVRSDRSVLLDEDFIPPLLTVGGSPVMAGYVREIEGLVSQRLETLAGRVSDGGVKGISEFGDYLLLLALNRYRPLLAHFAGVPTLHPEEVFRVFIQLSGELTTLFSKDRRAVAFPSYRHDDLQVTFAEVLAVLRRQLNEMLDMAAVPIDLQPSRFGVWFGALVDRTRLNGNGIILTVRADMPIEQLRQLFPAHCKIGPAEQIRDLVSSGSHGIMLRPLPVAPRQIPYQAGRLYFELERHGPYWEAMRKSSGFAVHVATEFPNLDLKLWAIREVVE